MDQLLDLAPPFDASPRFSKDVAFAFSPGKTAASSALVKPEKIVGSAAVQQPKAFYGVASAGEPIASQLFTATADAKIWTSRVSMHLDREVKNRLFRQLDSLHDADEWVAGDTPVNLESYKSCVRAILYHKINSRPALALMPSGNILALWQDGDDKLSIEFLPGNRTRWMVQSVTGGEKERAAGNAALERLRDVIAPYCASRWFSRS